MRYIILIAGKGSRLTPLTLNMPKSLFKLDKDTTILERMISIIEKHDNEAQFTVVCGFMAGEIESRLSKRRENVKLIMNPFYSVTNSIASLWFALEDLQKDVVIINGDIVMEEELVRDVVCKQVEKPCVLIDSSIKNNGDYNVQVLNGKILVMSKNLDNYYGEYAGVTKLDAKSACIVKKQVENMVRLGMYDQWYENALVQLIFDTDFELEYIDICNNKWTEVDCVDDMLLARRIQEKGKRL